MPTFSDAPNTAVLTTRQVIEGHLPILMVTHDADDGTWQFLDNVHEPTEDNVLVVALHRIVELDPSVQQVADLPLGHVATRTQPMSEWVAGRWEGA